MKTANQPKTITQDSLIRIFTDIKRLKSKEIRFCFLIGAGASKSSGIPSGWELSKKWYEEIKEEINSEEKSKWEERIGVELNADNVGRFYPYLYEKRYRSCPEVGYEEFKNMMQDKEPSIGYIILSNILVHECHNFVITTNFDYLIEDAVRMYTRTKPFIAGHETLAEFITTQTDRPTIIKVHRDLLLHPFSENENTSELKEEWKKALSPVLSNFNLLVLGYGGNDGSLMDYLNEIDSDSRKAIYWCVREDQELNDKICKLLTSKDFKVTINGFDELMYELSGALKYDIFENLDNPDKHPFVKAARGRIDDIKNKIEELTIKFKDSNAKDIPKGISNIIRGANDYLLQAYIEHLPEKKDILFKKGLITYPDDPGLLVAYAEFLYEREGIEQGNDYFQKAVDIKPDYNFAFINWGNLLNELANTKSGKKAEDLYRQAFEKYQKAIEIVPDDNVTFNNWGNSLVNLAKTKSSKEAEKLYRLSFEKYQKAVEINSDYHIAYVNWGNSLNELANTKSGKEAEELYRQAFEKFQKAVEIKPDFSEAYNNWGWTYFCKGDIELAEKYLMKSWDNTDKNESTAMNIAHLYLVKGNTERALEMYKRSCELYRNKHCFWRDYKRDFIVLEKYGITKEAYDKMRKQIELIIDKPKDKKDDK